jgi:hypothetical protein
MRSSSPLPLSPITAPNHGYLPLSPSADNSCSSPEEVDSLQTPLAGNDEHLIFSRHLCLGQTLVSKHSQAALLGEREDHEFVLDSGPISNLSALQFSSSSPTGETSSPHFNASGFHPSLHESLVIDTTSFDANPFAADFTAGYNDDESMDSIDSPPGYHHQALIHRSDNVFPPFGSCPPFLQASKNTSQALNLKAHLHSSRFSSDHLLNTFFVRSYQLQEELGSGGYGFVMIARHRIEGHEVAVKFIIKSKVPDYAWMEDDIVGRMPTEVLLLSYVEHENIVKCLDLFEDELYFYLVHPILIARWYHLFILLRFKNSMDRLGRRLKQNHL